MFTMAVPSSDGVSPRGTIVLTLPIAWEEGLETSSPVRVAYAPTLAAADKDTPDG
jgi:hypothetical protein